MQDLELAQFAPILTATVPHPVLFASVSGAHLYGFPSPDSDVDLRGCHVLPVRTMLGLGEPNATFNRTWEVAGVELDLVSHDVKKYALLLRQQNGNFLEQLLAPTVVVDTPWAEELREIIRRGGITRHVYHAYAGYARGKWQEWRGAALQGEGRIKSLLYAYRVVLTGIHVLETGEVNASLPALAQIFGLPDVLDLIAAKTAEKVVVDLPVAEHDARLAALLARLEEAYAATSLPENPTDRGALNDFVVRVRLAYG
jgi:hypothetical protein